ncbi:MAG: DUF4878 domain-containing protein, partial [Mycobacterium sp.]
MSHPTGPGQPDENTGESTDETAETPGSDHEPATEVMAPADPAAGDVDDQPGERRFTAPSGFDAGSTQIIDQPADPATEVFSSTEGGQPGEQQSVTPQLIPPRGDVPQRPKKKRSWAWVAAIVAVVAALAAIAILGTILLTRASTPKVSQEEMVRATIQDFDIAVQNGDLS